VRGDGQAARRPAGRRPRAGQAVRGGASPPGRRGRAGHRPSSTQQLAELRALPAPTGPHDGEAAAAWFADWDRYLADRRDHIAQLARPGHDKPFAESEANGGPISDRMDSLSTLNGMPSCVVPADFG
jgi:hypothetical protein